MTDPQPIVAILSKLIDNAPQIIAALAAAWVLLWRVNKKTEETAKETNKLVVAATTQSEANAQKIDDVHVIVNGDRSALQAKHAAEKARADALAAELESVKAQLKRRASKRRTDP